MRKDVKDARRAKRAAYMRAYYEDPARREKIKQRQRDYIQRLKDEGKYEEHLRRKAGQERKRLQQDPEYYRIKANQRNATWRGKYWERTLLRNARGRAFKKGLNVNIVEADIVIPDVCPVLGLRLEKAVGVMQDNSPSIDRIKPALGYVRGNIRVISQRANRLKCDGTAAEMKLIYKDLLRIEAL